MKIIGLIGGISSESTTEYYREINRKINRILGKHHTAKIIMVSLNFNEIVEAIVSNNWEEVVNIMTLAARKLEQAGADFIAMCSNTLYKVAPYIQKSTSLPLIHILEPVGKEIQKHKITNVGLIGTKFTMEDTFHTSYLYNNFQINCIIPDEQEKKAINEIIFNELCLGIFKQQSKNTLLEITNSLQQRGAQGVVLGCTELPFLLPYPGNVTIPIFDTADIHINAIVDFALSKETTK